MKKIIITILVFFISTYFLLLPGNILSNTEIGHAFNFVFNMNQFKLDISENLDKNKVEILWNNKNIYKNGCFNNNIVKQQRHIYGENIFVIIYDSKKIKEFTQYKFNNWNYYKYSFYIKNIDNMFKAKLEVIGLDKNIL